MAVITNTFSTTGSSTNRENLSDVVSRITPEDTPIYSMIKKGSTATTHPEWVIDTLAAPGANIQLEGDQYSYNATTAPSRVGNYTQIMRKTWAISKSQEKSDEAGNVLKRKETKLKRGIELRKDVEFSIVDTNASVAGTTRESGSLNTWLTTNVSRGATGANGGFVSGVTTAPTNGTQRAFTKTLLDTTMQAAYVAGGNVKNLVVSPYVKSVFVTFMSDSNVAASRHAVTDGKNNSIIANADIYEGPFGMVNVVPNRVMAASATQARNAFLIDPTMLEWLWFRPIHEDTNVASNADADVGVLIGEGALKVNAEAAHGVIADVFGLSAST